MLEMVLLFTLHIVHILLLNEKFVVFLPLTFLSVRKFTIFIHQINRSD